MSVSLVKPGRVSLVSFVKAYRDPSRPRVSLFKAYRDASRPRVSLVKANRV